MYEDNIKGWVANARESESHNEPKSGVKVVRKQPQHQSRGALIMEIAEKVRPVFQNFFRDRRDDNGVLFQPAHVRAFALNYAENLLKVAENNNSAVA